MGSHRAERSGVRRRPPGIDRTDRNYVGRRVARPADSTESTVLLDETVATAASQPTASVLPTQEVGRRDFTGVDFDAETREVPAYIDFDAETREVPAYVEAEIAVPTSVGRRRAVKHSAPRGPLFKGIPSTPVLVGVAALAIASGGAIASGAQPTLAGAGQTKYGAANAMNGASSVGTVGSADRGQQLSRDSDRQTLTTATDAKMVDRAERQNRERNAALGQLAQQAEQQADKIAENRWVSPLEPIVLTARFGEYGLWASYHTGLDFNGETGDPIKAISNGTVTFAGYDGSYGNKTVITLDDGTELWFAHQTDQYVTVGDVVQAGEVIGTVGATGNVTGSHLHVEVRPGGGDPVDPYPALLQHGIALP